MLKMPTNDVGQLRGSRARAPPRRRSAVRVLVDEHEPACANASVTIAKAIPPTRRRDRAEHERQHEPDRGRQRERLGQNAQSHCVIAIVGEVDADREVERVAEREQSREAEEQVVGERDAAEDEAEREQLQRARGC